MKKQLFVLLLMSIYFSTQPGFSQNSLGLSIGYDPYTIKYEKYDYRYVSGDVGQDLNTMSFAIYYNHSLKNWLNIQAESGFQQKGELRSKVGTDNTFKSLEVHTNFINFSLLAQLYPFGKEGIAPFFSLGGYSGYRLDASYSFTRNEITDDLFQDKFHEHIKRFDYGAIVGLGVNGALGRWRPSVSCNYQIGFPNLSKISPGDWLFPSSGANYLQSGYVVRTISIRLAVGYLLKP